MSGLRLRSATLSSAGGREVNEDALASAPGCWAVADGLGGHGGGEVAARLAVVAAIALLRDPAQQDPTPGTTALPSPRCLLAAMQRANQAVRDGQTIDSRLANMRTTLTLLVSDGTHARWAHLGDTRLYLFRHQRRVYQTTDHSIPQALVNAGELRLDQIRGHPDRHRLLRTLGKTHMPRPTISDPPLVLRPGDACLICTDGLWDLVLETEMETTLADSTGPETWLRALRRLVKARAHHGHDNYSAAAVLVE